MNVDHHDMAHQDFTSNGHGDAADQYDQHHKQRMLVHQQQILQHQQQHQQQQAPRQPSFSTAHDHFPFLHAKSQRVLPDLTYPAHPMQQHSQSHLSLSPMNSDQSSPTPTSPHSSFTFQQQHNGLPLHHSPSLPQHQQVHIPPQPLQSESSRDKRMLTSRSIPSIPTTSSRPTIKVSTSTPSTIASSSLSSASSNGPVNGSGKMTRSGVNGVNSGSSSTSTSSSSKRQQRSSSSPTGSGPPVQKQALLSPSQKKANHIQSEQKRRANIRRGYEALCETVPALREAIREEEEAERNVIASGRRKNRGRKNGNGGEGEGEKERLDGRAGPRSENVVLSKSTYCSYFLLCSLSTSRDFITILSFNS